jgi:pimeloyl-ACP methyl ester carboxylesterase
MPPCCSFQLANAGWDVSLIKASVDAAARPDVLLVPGAWHGRWSWHKVQPALAARGWRTHIVELPSTSGSGSPRKGLYDDAAVIRRRIKQIGRPVVVVAHSYGGAAVSEGAAHMSDVRHLVYLAAFALDIGESVLGLASGRVPDWWVIDGDVVTPGTPHEMLYEDVPLAEARMAITKLRPISFLSFQQRLTAAAWHTAPSTYIVCQRDRAVPVPLQEALAARATHVRRLPTSHSPFLAAPGQLTKLIIEAASSGPVRN